MQVRKTDKSNLPKWLDKKLTTEWEWVEFTPTELKKLLKLSPSLLEKLGAEWLWKVIPKE